MIEIDAGILTALLVAATMIGCALAVWLFSAEHRGSSISNEGRTGNWVESSFSQGPAEDRAAQRPIQFAFISDGTLRWRVKP